MNQVYHSKKYSSLVVFCVCFTFIRTNKMQLFKHKNLSLEFSIVLMKSACHCHTLPRQDRRKSRHVRGPRCNAARRHPDWG